MVQIGVWEREEGVAGAVEAALAAAGRAGLRLLTGAHPAALAGEALSLLTVSPGAVGWAGAGAIACRTVLLPGSAGPLARHLKADRAVSYGPSPKDSITLSSLEGDRILRGPSAGVGDGDRPGAGAAGAGASPPNRAGPPALAGGDGDSAAAGRAAGGALAGVGEKAWARRDVPAGPCCGNHGKEGRAGLEHGPPCGGKCEKRVNFGRNPCAQTNSGR